MRKLFFVMITPILCFSSLVLMFHDLIPSLWRNCIRPTVVNMRKAIKHEFIQRSSVKEKNRTAYKFLFSVLERRKFAIIRLIRLISDSTRILITNGSFCFERGCLFILSLDRRTPFSIV